LPSHHLEIIDSYIQLGLLKRKQLKYEEAKVYLSQAIELLEFQASPDTKRLGVAYNHLGNLYWSLVLTDDSIAAHKKALKFRLKNKDYVLIADSYNNIGVQYRVKKDWDASANYFQLAEKYYDQYSPGHPYSFYVKNNMAYVQEQRFKWQEVLRLYKETLAGFTKAYGDEHFNTLTVKKNLAKFYTRRLLNQQSINLWHEIIETYEISSKIEELAVSYSYLAHNYFQINQIEKSLKYYQKSMELIENVQIKNKREVADIFAFYALTYLELKQFEKAEQLTQKGIDLFSEENELGNSYRMFFINQLGDIKLITQQPLKAQRLFQQVLDLMNLNVAQNKVEKIKAFIGLSKIQLNFKNYDNALLNITKALDLAQQLYGKNHRLIAQVQFHLGEIYNEINQRNKALEHLNKALEIQKLVLAKGHKDLLATKLMIESLD
jgi:tetratricopeptide (TPR) repeat protein